MKIELPKLDNEARELLAYPQPLNEAAMTYADSCDSVIYTAKAHENVQNATQEEREYADTVLQDTGGIGPRDTSPVDVYDRTATMLSFWIEENRFMERVHGQLSTFRDAVEEAKSELDATLEAIKTILD